MRTKQYRFAKTNSSEARLRRAAHYLVKGGISPAKFYQYVVSGVRKELPSQRVLNVQHVFNAKTKAGTARSVSLTKTRKPLATQKVVGSAASHRG